MMSKLYTGNKTLVGAIPKRTDLVVITKDEDESRGYKEKRAIIMDLIKSFPDIKHMYYNEDDYEYQYGFFGTVIYFQITKQSEVRLFDNGKSISFEEVIGREDVPEWVKKFLAFNLDSEWRSNNTGWYVNEIVGIGVSNTKSLKALNLNVTKTK
jgi:hypothetical protein